MRRPRLCLASADSEALRGCRPGPIRGSATEVGRTGTGSGGKPSCRKAAKSPEERSLSHKSCDGASERRILLLPRRVVRRSISPHLRGEKRQKPNSRGGARTRALGCLNLPNRNLKRGTSSLAPLFRGERSARSAG